MTALFAATNIRPWHWLTILSCDAPVVALVWQDFLARSLGVSLTPSHRAVLGLSVWLAYVADRWLDSCQLPTEKVVTARHAFAKRFAGPLALAWSLVLAGTAGLAVAGLSRRELVAGLGLAFLVFGYLALCHRRRDVWPGGLKEFAVAALICGGSALFVLVRAPHVATTFWLSLAIFYGLCLLNCAAVSLWDQPVDRTQEQPSLALRFQLRPGQLQTVALASLTVLAGLSFMTTMTILRWTAIAGCVTVCGVLALIACGDSLELDTRRLLADATLLSPLLTVWFV